MLLPDKSVLVSLLRRYRVWEHLALAAPHDPARRRRLEDAAYTLCVLMGHRTAQEAVIAAETYLDKASRTGARAPEAAGERLGR
jgi:hypothetical protein